MEEPHTPDPVIRNPLDTPHVVPNRKDRRRAERHAHNPVSDTGVETQESGRLFQAGPAPEEQEGPRMVSNPEPTQQAVTHSPMPTQQLWLCVGCLVNAKTAMAKGVSNGSVPPINLAVTMVEGRFLCADHITVASPLLSGIQMPRS